jgi:hypothetical protein
VNEVELGALAVRTGPAVLVFATLFLFGDRIHPLRAFGADRRSLVSFASGMSAAYVFIRMMPELHEAREIIVESAAESVALPYEGISIYFVALIGFLFFYGLDVLRSRASGGHGEATREQGSGSMHITGMATYAGLMSYLLVRGSDGLIATTVLYTVAFGAHFLALQHSLLDEYGEAFRRTGRWVMAASCVAGWLIGVVLPLPAYVLALLVAFISGGVIMNSAVMELAEGKHGRFLPFVAGSLVYGFLLLALAS